MTLLGLLIAGLILGGLLVVGLMQVRGSLEAARGELGEVRAAVADVEIERASVAIASADAELRRARSWSESIVWSTGTLLPVVGRSVATTGEVVEVGAAALEVAGVAVAGGEQLLGGGMELSFSDGRLDLDPLLATRELMGQLPLGRLQLARDTLAAPRDGWMPDELVDARAQSLELADEALEVANLAESLSTALPGFLGAEGLRRYLVGMQTSAELRGTGGLIGYFAVLSVEEGALSIGGSEELEIAEDEAVALAASGLRGDDGPTTAYQGDLDGYLDRDPIDAEPDFAARYAQVGAMSKFANVNVDPHLPATAPVMLELFASFVGEQLDGVILLDPVGLQQMLQVTGPELSLDAEVAASLGAEDAVATDRFAELVTVDVYERLGSDRSEERRLALRSLGDAAFAQVFAGGWSSEEMVRAVAEAGSSRHLQVFSEQPEEQQAFTRLGATGALPTSPDSDVLAVVANNAVGGKQDVHLGHEFASRIHLGEPRRMDDGRLEAKRTSSLQVTVDNPLPSSGMDDYIIGNCIVPGDSNGCFRGEPGVNWTWFTAFLPAGTDLVGSRIDEGSQPLSEYGPYHGFHLVDHFQTTPSRSRASFELEFEGRVPLEAAPDGGVVYELLWWRQGKATPDLLDVVVEPPAGWEISELEVIGGGDGRGSGVHGEGVDLDAEVVDGVDGVASLKGTVTADTRLRVHLARAVQG